MYGISRHLVGRRLCVLKSLNAGLAAARQLDSFGYRVVIVEGHDRPGGRVYTKQLKVSHMLQHTHVVVH